MQHLPTTHHTGGGTMLVRHQGGLVSFEVADNSALAIQLRSRDTAEHFGAALGQYPQYAGWCEDAVLVQVHRSVRTKGGHCFDAGEYTLAQHSPAMHDIGMGEGYTCYSRSRGGLVFVPLADVTVVA
jgi:hypothetical protein